MERFRFGIMGAGQIARKFCAAVALVGGEVACVASKSLARAEAFARENGVARAYGDYAAMLDRESIDCVYIATTPDAHYALSLLCATRGVPVLCEKAMFVRGDEAREVLSLAREKGVFAMEALWSRFLPANRTARRWIEEGRIGVPSMADVSIGFAAPPMPSRYLDPALCGGVASDLTVYGYAMATYMLGGLPDAVRATAIHGETGVDVAEALLLRVGGAIATVRASFLTGLENRLVVYGTGGSVVVPRPHMAGEAHLYGPDGALVESFEDVRTDNGFVYEVREVMDCVRAGRVQSEAVPHAMTEGFAQVCDLVRGR